ncbi:hypothetical protein [Streptomyces reticuli]|uniref:hypothetical protein n=1 Tax=Streptomyces reticuli TaxID=1926 RepID=UPI00073DC43B|nr:hypothetical protein TUE45_pSRTUE45a_0025 [Streptomyces reticuli]
MTRELGGTLYEGTPPVVAVPTGLPMRDGSVLAALVLVVEPDGRVTIQLLCDESAARIVIPSDPRIHQWTAMARHGGGSISLIVSPGLPDTDLLILGRHLGPYGGPYWHLSVGCIPL